jgi:putative FmdB family regulatory protein
MPTYCFVCPECGFTGETVRPLKEYYKPFKCSECKTEMVRDYQAEAVNISGRDYRRPIVSDSLAISPEQIAEHKQLFPDIQVTSEGQPVFDNYSQHNKYLEKTGFRKKRKRRRRVPTSVIGGKKNSKKKT